MKRLFLGLFVAVLLALTGCASDTPTTELDGDLSANSRAAASEIQATATTRRRPRTTTTRRPRPNTTTTRRNRPPTPTTRTIPTPTTPTTPSRTGVAGAVIYEKNCSADRPCSFETGPAQLRLLSGSTVVARGNASSNGAFHIEAAPGNYTLEAKPPNKRQACDPVAVAVPADGYATVTVNCGAK